MRRAKIVATMGPASSDPSTLEKLLGLGVDVARLNFSHGRHEEHAQVLDRIRAASRHLGKAVAVLQDLQGPKIRTGPLKAGKVGVYLEPGSELGITTEDELPGDAHLISTTYPHLAEDVRPGDRLLVDDGLLEFRVLSTDGVRVRAEVVEGGVLGEHKGINLPGVALRAEALTAKDKADLAFGISHGVDFVALSFVRSPTDLATCRAEMERAGRVVPIIAKIEKSEAIENLDAIIAATEGIMVARGDLGVEILPERVPILQKEMCRKANALGKPVIIATQMLNSMCEHPRPTRAEASDVANGIWDGADAVMLSGETARLMAEFRPNVPIVAFSPDQAIRRRLALYWGVVPKVMDPVKNADLMTEMVSDRLLEDGVAAPGDKVVLVHGSPLGVPGQTNSIRLHEIAHPAERGPGQRYRVPI